MWPAYSMNPQETRKWQVKISIFPSSSQLWLRKKASVSRHKGNEVVCIGKGMSAFSGVEKTSSVAGVTFWATFTILEEGSGMWKVSGVISKCVFMEYFTYDWRGLLCAFSNSDVSFSWNRDGKLCHHIKVLPSYELRVIMWRQSLICDTFKNIFQR